MRHVLDQRIRFVCARMELHLSYGATARFDSDRSRGKATGGNRPSGEPEPAHEVYMRQYLAQEDNAGRLAVCEEAEVEFTRQTSWKAGIVNEETWEQIKARVCVPKYEGESPKDVAHWERLTAALVRKARAEGAKGGPARHIESGRPIERSARELVKKGLPVRAIVEITGMSHGTVQRMREEWLKSAA